MIKAIFTKEQQPATIKKLDGKDFFYICLNPEEKTDPETGNTYFEYDYNEFALPEGKLNSDEVKANPESYIDYIVEEKAELTAEEQLNDIQLAIAELYEMIIGE